MSTRFHLSLLALAGLGLAACSDAPTSSGGNDPFLRLASEDSVATTIDYSQVADSYIVVLSSSTSDVAAAASELGRAHGLTVGRTYSFVMKGFEATVPAARLDALRRSGLVSAVYPNNRVAACSTSAFQTLPWGINYVDADISSTKAGDKQGAVGGVRVYIVDTGVSTIHTDLNLVGGRNFVAYNDPNDPNSALTPDNYWDGNGHGTHVAGSAAAKDNNEYVVGVAPGAPLYSVRVLDKYGSGTDATVIAGLDWILSEVRAQKTAGTFQPTVVNMSLGGGPSTPLDDAVRALINEGVIVVVAAGNDTQPASNYSPARVADAITVGAHDSGSKFATFSNYGSVVDINAPGVNILSTYYTHAGYSTKSGTSMAAPHVAGAAALLLSNSTNASMTPAQVRDRLVADARANLKAVKTGTTNRSLYVGGKVGSTPKY